MNKNYVGIAVRCHICRRTKAPHGRSVPDVTYASYCNHNCEGYEYEPLPGCLWPGETSEDFGYRHCLSATRESALSDDD